MQLFESLAKSLELVLSLWGNHEKTKFQNDLADIQKRKRDEWAKDPSFRSDAVLDDIDFELCQLTGRLSASIGSANVTPKPGSPGV